MAAHHLLTFATGMVLLVGGAELLVRGASRLAAAVGLSPLVIGLTVVAFGTSAPELAVSLRGALAGEADLALGNVVGSNVFNVLVILGLSALLVPLGVDRKLVRLDVPLMIVASFVVLALALDGSIGRLEGAALVSCGVVYTLWLFWEARREGVARAWSGEAARAPTGRPWASVLLVAGGLVALVLGARLLIAAAVALARAQGVSELLVGLTLVAGGTSLPEVAASVVAGLRGERDIAVGNVIGSNLFNLLFVLGASAVVAPPGVAVAPAALVFDLPVMVAVAVACLPIVLTDYRVDRWEGGFFLACYAAYLLLLYLAAVGNELAGPSGRLVLALVVPLIAVPLAVMALRTLRQGRPRAGNGG